MDEDDDDDKVKAANRTKNNKAYLDLTMAMEEKQGFGCVDEACTVANPSGLAALAWQNLCNRYEPVTVTTMLELRNTWATVTLKD